MNINSDNITMIDISSVKIVNPRSRNKFKHNEIIESIDKQGLRKPITVRLIKDKDYKYALICGQGRLESFSKLNEHLIPAFIVDVDEDTAYIMSLIENMARVNPRTGEQFNRIKEMVIDGASAKDISKFTGLSVNWVNSILMLLDKGERKLLAAVDSGKLPISLAVEIAKTDHEGAQELFIEAFEKGAIKHKDLIKIRKILDDRNDGLKGVIDSAYRRAPNKKKLSTEDLTKLFQDNIEEHKSLKNKARIIEENILLTQQIIKELTDDINFINLIKKENLYENLVIIQKPQQEIGK